MEGLLQYIDQIDQSVADSELSVLESLIESYDKSIMILENCDETTDLSAFDIFQEGEKWDKFKEDTKAPILGNKEESLIKRLAMILPRLIRKIAAIVHNFFKRSNSMEKKMDNDIQNLENAVKNSMDDVANNAAEFAKKSFEKAGDAIVKNMADEMIEDLEYAKKLHDMKNPKTGKKVDLNNVMLHVKNASYFGSLNKNDNPFTKDSEIEFKARGTYDFSMIPDLLKEYGNPKANDDVKRGMQEIHRQASLMDNVYETMKQKASSFYEIRVSYNDAIEVFEKMKEIITEKLSRRKQNAEIIDSFIKELNTKNDQFNKKNNMQPLADMLSGFHAQSEIISDEERSRRYYEKRQTLQLWVDFTKALSHLSTSLARLTILDETIWNENYNAVMNAIEELKTKGYSDKETHTVNL